MGCGGSKGVETKKEEEQKQEEVKPEGAEEQKPAEEQPAEEQKPAEIRIQRDHRLAVRWADKTSSKGNAAAGEESAGFFKENIQFRSWKSFRSYQERTGNYRKAVHKAGRSHGYGSTGCHFSGGCI